MDLLIFMRLYCQNIEKPIQRSLINLEKFTGISFMKLNNVLDSGPIFNQYKIPINKNDNSETLSKLLSELSADKIIHNIKLILSNKATFLDQMHNEASYAEKINKKRRKKLIGVKAHKIF